MTTSAQTSLRTSFLGIAALCTAIFMLYVNLPVVATTMGRPPAAVAAVIFGLLVFAVCHELVIAGRLPVVDRTSLLILLLLGVFIVSTVNAVGYDVALDRILVFVSEGIAIYVLVRNAVRTPTALRAAMVAMLLAAAFLAMITIVQSITRTFEQSYLGLAQRSFGDPNVVGEALELEERALGPVGEANRFGQVLLMAAPIGFVLARNARRVSRGAMAFALMLLVLGGVMLTYSRGAFVTLVVLMVLAVPMRLLTLRSLMTTGAIAIVATLVLIPNYAGRVVSIAGVADLFGTKTATVEADGATLGRTTEMLAALAVYVDHPVIGVGPGQYVAFHSQKYMSLPEISIRDITEPRRAHNLYIELAAETGTIGLVVFMAIPLLLLRDLELLRRTAWSRGHVRRARLAAGFSLVILSYLGTGVFLHLAFERYYWLMIGLSAAAVGILREEIELVSEPRVPVIASAVGAPAGRRAEC